ncbi:MAG: DUF1501 domain-containing protein, partial [Tagaea sp.]
MCPGGYPIKGPENWRAAFLPGAFQGTYVDTKKKTVAELVEHVRHPLLDREAQRRQLDLTATLDRGHLAASACIRQASSIDASRASSCGSRGRAARWPRSRVAVRSSCRRCASR